MMVEHGNLPLEGDNAWEGEIWPSRRKYNKGDSKEKLWHKCANKTSNNRAIKRKSTKRQNAGVKNEIA